ncbi:MAG: hypothetical protein WC178_00245 [Candidatus Paceibacterota bacterium]
MTNEEQILEMLKQNQITIEKTYISAEKTRKIFFYSAILTILAFLLPLLGLIFILPMFISTFTDSLGGSL